MDFPPIDELVSALMEHDDARVRAKAASLIGEMSHTLNAKDREFAKQALNRAMTDIDPTVLMSVMNAIGQFASIEVEEEHEEEDDDTPLEKAEACAVCGRPMALVDAGTCEVGNCPYG